MVDEETGEEVEGEGGDPDLARKVLQRGYDALRKEGLKEERVVLLEAWKEFEAFHGEDADREKVEGMMPRVVKKWRKTDDGANALEECTSGRIVGRSSRLERRLTFLTLLPRAQTGT
jgi:crooked neck